MSGEVGALLERNDRPAYVRFETLAVENKTASLAAGHYVGTDVDYALITPPYSKDVFKIKVAQWKANLLQDVENGRLPQEWVDRYLDSYKRWKSGQEIPVHGTAIKGWGVLSPAQQETLLRINVLTVEDLAGINDEGIKRIGMGGQDLKNKAVAWLSQLRDKGPLTQEVASLKADKELLEKNIASLSAQVQLLAAQVKAFHLGVEANKGMQKPQQDDIAVDEIIDVPPASKSRQEKQTKAEQL